ncbi:MAG: hypothetical protein AAF417_18745 [Pseudomonadota bacterium]
MSDSTYDDLSTYEQTFEEMYGYSLDEAVLEVPTYDSSSSAEALTEEEALQLVSDALSPQEEWETTRSPEYWAVTYAITTAQSMLLNYAGTAFTVSAATPFSYAAYYALDFVGRVIGEILERTGNEEAASFFPQNDGVLASNLDTDVELGDLGEYEWVEDAIDILGQSGLGMIDAFMHTASYFSRDGVDDWQEDNYQMASSLISAKQAQEAAEDYEAPPPATIETGHAAGMFKPWTDVDLEDHIDPTMLETLSNGQKQFLKQELGAEFFDRVYISNTVQSVDVCVIRPKPITIPAANRSPLRRQPDQHSGAIRSPFRRQPDQF